MGVKYAIFYHPKVVKEDIPSIGTRERKIIQLNIEIKLMNDPARYSKPLRQSLSNYRKLRVGNYRIVFRIEKQTIKILVIAHRKSVYNLAGKREF